MNLRSIDAPRRRPAPTTFTYVTESGEQRSAELRPRTLVVAVKSHCDGCAPFLDGELKFESWELLVIAREAVNHAGGRHVVVSPELFTTLEISSAPFYVALDGAPLEVVTEGVVFAPEQVRVELSSF